MKRNTFLKIWPKLFFVVFFLLLLGAYANIFAVGIYSPGEILDPTCAPLDPDCTVNLNSITPTNILGGLGGQILYQSAVDTTSKLTNGTAGQILTSNGTTLAPSWETIVGGLGSDADFNTFGGADAGLNITPGSSAHNTGIGYQALYSNTIGSYNTASGYQALYSNTTGYDNTANGRQSLYSNTTGYDNTANGIYSLYSNTTGHKNTANGQLSLFSNTTGYQNTANGYYSLYNNTTGYNNTTNGYFAGSFIANGWEANTTSNNSLYLGYDTRALADGDTNEIVIGASAIGNGSNTTTIGNTSTLRTYLTGLNLKAGTATAGTAPLKFTSGVLLTTPAAGAMEFLTDKYYGTITTGGARKTFAFLESPIFTTPSLGVATATSINNLPLSFNATDSNIKIGTNAGLNLVVSARNNTFIGYETGKSSSTLSTNTAWHNTAVGYQSFYSNTTGYNNSAIGEKSLYSNTEGLQNSAVGNESLYSNTTGFTNSAVGNRSLYSNTTGTGNSALGLNSLYYNTTGNNNSAIGYQSGVHIADGTTANTTGDYNIFIGYETKALADDDQNEIVIGASAIGNGSNTATIGDTNLLRTYLTGLNLKAGTATTGTAPLKFTSGTVLGTTEAGAVEYDGSHLYFTATDAGTRYQLDQQGGGLGSDANFNTKGGTNAGLNLIAGHQFNTFLGYEAGKSSVWAGESNLIDNNTAIGYHSLYSNYVGWGNTANGSNSLYSNYMGSNNTANGFNSLYSNTDAYNNTANGYSSLYSNTTGPGNTANGANSLYSNTTGSYNATNGYNSLYSNTTGNYNSAIGHQSGQYIANGSTANTTGDYNVFLGSDTKPLADDDQNEIVIGYNTTGNGSNTTTIGTDNVLYVGGSTVSGKVARFTSSSGYCDISPLTTSLSCSSDINLKKNIVTIEDKEFSLQTVPDISNLSTLEKLSYLTPVNYNWNSELDTDSKHVGFIAQEMEQIFPSLVSTDEKTGLKSISYASITPYLVEAIKEMDLKITNITKINNLEIENTWRDSMIAWFENKANGIGEFVAGVLRAQDKLCIGEGSDEVCITKEELLQMKNNNQPIVIIQNAPITPEVVAPEVPVVPSPDPTITEEEPVANPETPTITPDPDAVIVPEPEAPIIVTTPEVTNDTIETPTILDPVTAI